MKLIDVKFFVEKPERLRLFSLGRKFNTLNDVNESGCQFERFREVRAVLL
jgi:hypothetical protein